MAEIQLPSEKGQEEIFRRGRDAEAFMHSPLFVDFKAWVTEEGNSLGYLIAKDIREKSQEKLTRSEFVEQMSGYYRGVYTALAVFQGFVDKAGQLRQILDKKSEVESEKQKDELVMKQLKEQAYGH